jgi:hypothetical protein
MEGEGGPLHTTYCTNIFVVSPTGGMYTYTEVYLLISSINDSANKNEQAYGLFF